MPPLLIAEYKRRAWDGTPLTDRPIEDVVAEYDADPAVWAVSVVVDERWGGKDADLSWARMATGKPLLAKGLAVDHEQARSFGADYSLTYEAAEATDTRWVEVNTYGELATARYANAPVVVLNNRNVRTGELVPGHAEELARRLPPDVRWVAASGYSSVEWAPPGAWAVLIGTALLGEA